MLETTTSPYQRLQQLGERCLLLCVFYPGIVDEYDLELEHFIVVGIDTYKTLAMHELDDEGIFSYLASYFLSIIAELAEFLLKVVQRTCK